MPDYRLELSEVELSRYRMTAEMALSRNRDLWAAVRSAGVENATVGGRRAGPASSQLGRY